MKLLMTKALLLALALAGCNGADDGVFKSTDGVESKPATTLLSGTEGLQGGLNAIGAAPVPAATVNYMLTVDGNTNARICNGSVQLTIMSDFTLKVPTAKIQCESYLIDLAGLLASSGGLGGLSGGTGQDASGNLSDDGMVLSIKSIAGGVFTPPRPLLLGPIVQDASKFAGFHRTSTHTLVAQDDTGKTLTADGSFDVQVLNVDTTYENKWVGKAFDKVLDWKMTTTGFTGIPARYGLTFQSWEWLWNVRPIMILKIEIKGQLSDFISGGDMDPSAAATTNALLNVMTIDLIVQEYKF